MTNWLASTSLKNTSWPVSGHLIQRFSGDSRRLRKLRIFGRTTLEIQFMAQSLASNYGDFFAPRTPLASSATSEVTALTVLPVGLPFLSRLSFTAVTSA